MTSDDRLCVVIAVYNERDAVGEKGRERGTVPKNWGFGGPFPSAGKFDIICGVAGLWTEIQGLK